MITTVLLSLILMAGLFLMLWAGVGFIQDKRFFTSAPKDALESLLPKSERFPGQHALGWVLGIVAILLMAGAVFYAGWDGVRNGFTFMQFFTRYLIMFWSLKVYDILFFDLFLLCHSQFFPHYYPEAKEHYGPHQFGYNRKSHAIQIVGFVILAAVLAWICTLL